MKNKKIIWHFSLFIFTTLVAEKHHTMKNCCCSSGDVEKFPSISEAKSIRKRMFIYVHFFVCVIEKFLLNNIKRENLIAIAARELAKKCEKHKKKSEQKS
jgi:hypothetical protein